MGELRPAKGQAVTGVGDGTLSIRILSLLRITSACAGFTQGMGLSALTELQQGEEEKTSTAIFPPLFLFPSS